MTVTQEKQEFKKMTDKELTAYASILRMSARCLMSSEDRELTERHTRLVKAETARRRRAERDAVLRSLGMKKVRGALGDIYWE